MTTHRPADPAGVRPATPADRDALAAIDAAAWDARSTPAALPLGTAWLDDLADTLVAERAARVVGYALIGPRTPLAASAHLGLLRSLAVHPDARGQGIGRALLRAVADAGRARGWERLQLQVLATNDAALRLYTAEGFRTVAHLVDHFRIAGEPVDDLLLELPLAAATAEPAWLEGGCHCRAVRFRACVRTWELLDCNCSICAKKGILHLIVPPGDFELLSGEDALATYTFGTHTARHHFCRTCGIHPFYRPRSHPDAYDLNARCLDDDAVRRLRVLPFDGRRWEERVGELR